MATWIALFRGINVGGKNILPMAELRAELAALGLEDVKTYIQSGNAVFRSKTRSAAKLQDAIADAVEASHGFRAPVLALSGADLARAERDNPFPEAPEDKFVLACFLFAKPKKPDLAALEADIARAVQTREAELAVAF